MADVQDQQQEARQQEEPQQEPPEHGGHARKHDAGLFFGGGGREEKKIKEEEEKKPLPQVWKSKGGNSCSNTCGQRRGRPGPTNIASVDLVMSCNRVSTSLIQALGRQRRCWNSGEKKPYCN